MTTFRCSTCASTLDVWAPTCYACWYSGRMTGSTPRWSDAAWREYTSSEDAKPFIKKLQCWWRLKKNPDYARVVWKNNVLAMRERVRECEDCGSINKRKSGACYDCYYHNRYGPVGWDRND